MFLVMGECSGDVGRSFRRKSATFSEQSNAVFFTSQITEFKLTFKNWVDLDFWLQKQKRGQIYFFPFLFFLEKK